HAENARNPAGLGFLRFFLRAGSFAFSRPLSRARSAGGTACANMRHICVNDESEVHRLPRTPQRGGQILA
ncbi:MAG: hypothetical protein ACREH3_14685, partial [Geminicoccales bacterium]